MMILRIVYLLLLSCMLSACGFQLRQAIQLPQAYQAISLQGTLSVQLKRELKQQLIQQGLSVIEFSSNSSEKTLQIKLKDEHLSSRPIAFVENNIRAYRIDLSLIFSIASEDGQILLPERQLRLSRKMDYDNQQILSSAQEENIIHQELRQKAVKQIINALAIMSKKFNNN